MASIWGWVVILSGMSSVADDGDKKAPAATADPVERIERLEKELEALKRDARLPRTMSLEDQEKKDAPKAEMEYKVTFTDGFHLSSTDKAFDLHIGGRWLEEYRYTFDRHPDAPVRTSTNTFYAREAFISLDGTLWTNWGFKLNGDFSQPQTSATGSSGAIIEEAWVEWKAYKEFRLQFGSFKQPCSFEITD